LKEGPEELLAKQPAEIQQLVEQLRAMLRGALPAAVETQRRPIIFGFGRTNRMSDLLFAVQPHREHVNLEFANGATLPDPDRLLEGSGKNIRHVKIRSLEDVDKPSIRALVEAQLEARPAS
jgi:hypothetical protein